MNVQNLNPAGVVTFWSLSEYSRLADLRDGFRAAGLGKQAPEAAHPSAALKGALGAVFEDAKYLIRPLKKRGYCVVIEERGAEENRFSTVARAVLDDAGALECWAHDWSTEDKIRLAFEEHKSLVTAGQLSGVLSRLAQGHFGGTALRPTGGIYWLHQSHADCWGALSRVVEAAAIKSSAVYLLRHDLDPDSVRAVQDAIFAEVTGEADRLQAAIDSGELGARGLEGRRRDAEALRAKVQEYETILGVGLSTLHEVLQAVEGAALEAIMLDAAGDPDQSTLAFVA